MTDQTADCRHSFPVTPPHGSMDQPGTCRHCAITYRDAIAARTHDDGPSVREAAADDRAHWTDKYAEEGP